MEDVLRGLLQRKPHYATIRLARLHRLARAGGTVLRTVLLLPPHVDVDGARYLVYVEEGGRVRVWLVRSDVAHLVLPEGAVPLEEYRSRFSRRRGGRRRGRRARAG